VYLAPDAAQHIGLALHELATNAAKYGAWSIPAGQVTVTWETSKNRPDAGLLLSWRERNGPRVERPSRKGFGTILTEQVIADAVEANVAAEYAPDGLTWTIEIPSRYMPAIF
jgi:two-component sensor histidine kinase